MGLDHLAGTVAVRSAHGLCRYLHDSWRANPAAVFAAAGRGKCGRSICSRLVDAHPGNRGTCNLRHGLPLSCFRLTVRKSSILVPRHRHGEVTSYSVNATANGMALGPRGGVVHHPPRGPSAKIAASCPRVQGNAERKARQRSLLQHTGYQDSMNTAAALFPFSNLLEITRLSALAESYEKQQELVSLCRETGRAFLASMPTRHRFRCEACGIETTEVELHFEDPKQAPIGQVTFGMWGTPKGHHFCIDLSGLHGILSHDHALPAEFTALLEGAAR